MPVETWTLPDEPPYFLLRDVNDHDMTFTKIREGMNKGLWRTATGGLMGWGEVLCNHEVERVLPPQPQPGTIVVGRKSGDRYRRRDTGVDKQYGRWTRIGTDYLASSIVGEEFSWSSLHAKEGSVQLVDEVIVPIEDAAVTENARLRAKVQELRTALDRERATRMDAEKECRDKNRMLDAQAAQLATIRRVVGGNV